MAILKFKKLLEDLESNSSLVMSSLIKVAATASNAGYATTSAYSGTSYIAGTVVASQIHGGAGTHAY